MDHNYSSRYCRWPRVAFIRLNVSIFALAFGVYGISRFTSFPTILPSSLGGHFHDLLATPVLLSATNLWIIACRRSDLVLVRLRSIFALSIIAGVFWEFVTPLYRTSTTDILDLLAYTIGGLLYFVVLRAFNYLSHLSLGVDGKPES
jgi:hypothetical protein